MTKDEVKPIDTSTLGPIKVDPRKMAIRAKIVRDALVAIYENTAFDMNDRLVAHQMSKCSNTALDLLGRMIK